MEYKEWYSLDIGEVYRGLKTDPGRGLDGGEAAARIKTYGRNTLREQPARSLLSMFTAQMKEALVLILVAAALISGLLGEWEDTIVILVIVAFKLYKSSGGGGSPGP